MVVLGGGVEELPRPVAGRCLLGGLGTVLGIVGDREWTSCLIRPETAARVFVVIVHGSGGGATGLRDLVNGEMQGGGIVWLSSAWLTRAGQVGASLSGVVLGR